MIITHGFVGIDVSKHHLDVLESSDSRSYRIANDAEALAALTAADIAFARVNPARARSSCFGMMYQRLRAAGKPAKLALIAIARKLLVTAHAILRDRTAFQP